MNNDIALEITKLYMSKKLVDMDPIEYAKFFMNVYSEISNFLKSEEV